MLRHLRLGALGAALVSTVTTVALATPAVAAASSADAGGQLATYLAAHDDHLHTTYNNVEYADYGLTLDAVLALNAANVGAAESGNALSYVADNLSSYIGSDGEEYAGPTAKALLATESAKPDANGNLGGIDLVSRLRGLEKDTGRFSDVSQYGDFSNTFGQSFALIALKRAGVTPSAKSVSFLLLQQCPNGGFRTTEKGKACTSNAGTNGAGPESDATAMAMQGLLSTPATAARKAALAKAATFLQNRQGKAGALDGNANSTGLAVPAMDQLGKDTFVQKAQSFLGTLQYDCSAAPAAQGLFAYNAAAKKASGTDAPTEQDLRATPDAILGVTAARYAKISITGDSDDQPLLECP